MIQRIRILMLEDVPTDAELAERELQRAGVDFEARRVDTRESFVRELEEFAPNVILADYSLPSFDGISALAIAKELLPDTPFIFVSGTLGEEIAVETLKSGATDYVLKHNLSRLAPSLRRALREAEERRERLLAQRALAESLRFIQNIADASPNLLYVYDLVDRRNVYVNSQVMPMLGYTPEEIQKMGSALLENLIHPDDLARVHEHIKKFDTSGKDEVVEIEYRARRATGEWRWIYGRDTVLSYTAGGPPLQILGMAQDISERKKAEDDLRHSEEHNRAILASLTAHIAVLDKAGTVISMNKAWEEFAGSGSHVSRFHAPVGTNYLEALRRAAEESDQAREALVGTRAVLEDTRPRFTLEYSCQAASEKRWFIMLVSPLRHSRGGAVVSHVEISEMKRLEELFLQAQKMEAVGRLAGGIAHDFNNLLTAIIGYSQMLLMGAAPGAPGRNELEEIEKAGSRAAALTSQLLAFSRKQVLQPRTLNLNDVVANLERMLRRLIGEDVELRTLLDPGLWFVKADPGQMEQVIVNLAVNARDAMPQGGKLTVETQNVDLSQDYPRTRIDVQPGPYVMLAVSDTGSGMSPEVQARIFEPFFTTKEQSKGTGLGLSTVYGIVKQSGGHIWLYSEPDRGTTFKIFLPRLADFTVSHTSENKTYTLTGGTETILLAEDEPAVRTFAARVLRAQGYTVLEASNGEEAMAVAREHPETRIDLLITDIIMPAVGGKALSLQLKELRPEIRVLFTSGYTDQSIFDVDMLGPGSDFLQKPFTPYNLTRKVREVLEA